MKRITRSFSQSKVCVEFYGRKEICKKAAPKSVGEIDFCSIYRLVEDECI